MITWLRRLICKNESVGVPLAAAYLLCRWVWVRKRTALGGAALGLTALLLASLPFSAQRIAVRQKPTAIALAYSVTDLGALPGGNGMSWAADINDAGQVVGSSFTGNRKLHAFLWQNGKMSDLGALSGGQSHAAHINASGLITGSSSASDGRERAVIWRNTVLKPLDVGGTESAAIGVNKRDEVVGLLGSGHHFDYKAFMWRNGDSRDLGPFIACSINTDGQVVGYEVDARTASAVLYRNGGIRKLPTLGGEISLAYSINDEGWIAGMCSLTNGDAAAVLWKQDRVADLGTLGGHIRYAIAINNRGQVVGSADTAQNQRHAFLWQNSKMTDLNDAIPRGSGWVLMSANGINERGWVVGQGEHAGRMHAFLLTPTDR